MWFVVPAPASKVTEEWVKAEILPWLAQEVSGRLRYTTKADGVTNGRSCKWWMKSASPTSIHFFILSLAYEESRRIFQCSIPCLSHLWTVLLPYKLVHTLTSSHLVYFPLWQILKPDFSLSYMEYWKFAKKHFRSSVTHTKYGNYVRRWIC